MIKKIDYNGHTVEYDDGALHKWSVMKALASGTGTFDAWDKILCGKSDEVAAMLDDDMDAMQDLLQRISLVEGGAKN